MHWEFHIDETSEELWMIDGLIPPPGRSEAEMAWAEANAPLPY
ncbi:tautomerase family protein [Rhodococcus sp. 06-462-5]